MPKHARSIPGYMKEKQNSTIEVFDDRPELEKSMKLIATFHNVPTEWSDDRVINHFGIADHLHVVRSSDRLRETIQEGRR